MSNASADTIITALALPQAARVDRRIPKKVLIDQARLTPAQRRAISERIESLHWIASIKPTTAAIPVRHGDGAYDEINVIIASIRGDKSITKLVEQLHRAVPYPVMLITMSPHGLGVHLQHKRASKSSGDEIVPDGLVVATTLQESEGKIESYLTDLALAEQPHDDINTCYAGWIEVVESIEASRITGAYRRSKTRPAATAQRASLERHRELEALIAALRAQAKRERQINRRVELNNQIKSLEREREVLHEQLLG